MNAPPVDSATAPAALLLAVRRVEKSTAWVIGLVGIVVSAGWIFEVPLLVRLHPGWASMKLNTALSFLALGLGLWFLTHRRPRTAAALACLVVAIGVLTLLQHVLGIDFGIDTAIVDPTALDSRTPLGRMTPVTALLFCLGGIALALCCLPTSARPSGTVGALASIIGGVSLAAMIGYATHTPAAYTWGAVSSVALHTAGSFLLFSMALAVETTTWSKEYLPRWLPWAALLGGLACTLALGNALRVLLEPDAPTPIPEMTLAVGSSLSLMAAAALYSQRVIGNQRMMLADAFAKQHEALVARARLAAIVESSDDAIISVDLDTRIVVWNGAAERLFGYAASEVMGSSLSVIVPAEAMDDASRVARNARAGIASHGWRTRRRHRDGRILDVEIDVSPVRDDQGQIIGTAGLVRDLAARLETEQMIQGVLEAAPDAMVVADARGAIVLVNSMAELLFGYSRNDLIGETVEMLIPEGLRSSHRQLRGQFMNAPRQIAMGTGRELQALRKGGAEFPAEITLNHLNLRHGTLFVAAIRDITARREARQRLTDSLAEKELLLKEIHHRVKNNLQVVASMLALQMEGLDDPRVRSPLELCRQRVLSMSLVHEKLYGARDLRRIDLGELAREIASMLLSEEPAGGVQVTFSLDPVVVDVETAFPASLLINELITNALKHAFLGRPAGRLEIAVRRLSEDRTEVLVADDGPGGVTYESLMTGTSLGSVIIRHLARQLNAKLSVTTPGCRVAVTFPLSRDQRK